MRDKAEDTDVAVKMAHFLLYPLHVSNCFQTLAPEPAAGVEELRGLIEEYRGFGMFSLIRVLVFRGWRHWGLAALSVMLLIGQWAGIIVAAHMHTILESWRLLLCLVCSEQQSPRWFDLVQCCFGIRIFTAVSELFAAAGLWREFHGSADGRCRGGKCVTTCVPGALFVLSQKEAQDPRVKHAHTANNTNIATAYNPQSNNTGPIGFIAFKLRMLGLGGCPG